jgi:hypothetical protein
MFLRAVVDSVAVAGGMAILSFTAAVLLIRLLRGLR